MIHSQHVKGSRCLPASACACSRPSGRNRCAAMQCFLLKQQLGLRAFVFAEGLIVSALLTPETEALAPQPIIVPNEYICSHLFEDVCP